MSKKTRLDRPEDYLFPGTKVLCNRLALINQPKPSGKAGEAPHPECGVPVLTSIRLTIDIWSRFITNLDRAHAPYNEALERR